jgi:hypothetical protein
MRVKPFIIIASFFFITLGAINSAQAQAEINKAQIESYFKELGISMSDIKSFYIKNHVQAYKDESIKRLATKYIVPEDKLMLANGGIKHYYYKGGKLQSISFYPYSSISYLQVSKTMVYITLKD